jgi:hypothetical protein
MGGTLALTVPWTVSQLTRTVPYKPYVNKLTLLPLLMCAPCSAGEQQLQKQQQQRKAWPAQQQQQQRAHQGPACCGPSHGML